MKRSDSIVFFLEFISLNLYNKFIADRESFWGMKVMVKLNYIYIHIVAISMLIAACLISRFF